ncbi:MAG TPA: aminoglycoside phosphotransferase [Gammaproteobacteria bacterium]|nr:aminoglycoside phosphotransferase [Gammaproteobacteria bacterium]
MKDERYQAMQQWLDNMERFGQYTIEPASTDASFRRYFRVRQDGQSWIVMDAPPANEDCSAFVRIAQAWREQGLNLPEVLEQDLSQGLLLLSDLGQQQYLSVLNEQTVDRLYGDAMSALLVLQTCAPDFQNLPLYSEELLYDEMDLFREWFLAEHLKVKVTPSMTATLDRIFTVLINSALEQPVVCVHRDYHSRNLMRCDKNNPGILDFQDAVTGPVTYDLVSLLRDCYIAWPRQRIENWVLGYYELAVQSGILQHQDEQTFLRWFDLIGVQRHLKVLGIFARLNYRDGKAAYLDDLPLVLAYVMDVCQRYPELADLHELILQHVEPLLTPATLLA